MKLSGKVTVVTAASAALLALGTAAHAQVIVNGTFDTFVPSNATGGGWTTVSIDGAGGHRTTGGNPAARFILNDNGGADDPTIAQTIGSLTPGTTYTITGEYQLVFQGGSASVLSFGASIDGVFLFETASPGDSNWHPFSFNFTAGAASATLLMAAERNGTDMGYAVDNIGIAIVQSSAAPEPGTLALLGMASAAGFLLRRRKR